MTQEILDLHFLSPKPASFECEIITLHQLQSRNLNHSLTQPQRLHFYLVIFVTAGEGQHLIDFQPYPYQKGTLLFVAENQVQQFQPQQTANAFLLLFTKEFFYQTTEDQELLQNYRLFDFSLQLPILQLTEAEQGIFLRLFEEIQNECATIITENFNEEIVRSLLRVLLLKAARLKRARTLPDTLPYYEDFSRFREQVEQNFNSSRNVQDYAHALGFTAKKLNQLTRIILNKTPKEFIDERVLLEIKRLLVHTRLSVGEIAYRSGFDEATNLVKFFKRYTGQTPTEFRTTLRLP